MLVTQSLLKMWNHFQYQVYYDICKYISIDNSIEMYGGDIENELISARLQ